MLARLNWYVRRRETATARFLYGLAKGFIRFNVPVIPVVHTGLYSATMGAVVGLRWLKQKFLCEPMFRSRCASCGPGLQIDSGLPLVSSYLQLHVGNNVFLSGENGFVAPAISRNPTIRIGDGTMLGNGSTINASKSVTIGKRCLIGRRVFIADNNGHPLSPSRRAEKVPDNEIEPVEIGDDVWIGHGAFVGPGVKIGNGSVVAANSVVKSVPGCSIVIGSPARVVRMLTDEAPTSVRAESAG